MKRETLRLICCPNCGHELNIYERQIVGNEVVGGLLECKSCGKTFGITNGVPRMIVNLGNREGLAESWGYEWTTMMDGKLEIDTYYGVTEDEDLANFFNSFGIYAGDLRGKKVLDAGCGCGRLTKILGKYGAYVVGIDIANSIENIYDYCRTQPNVDIIQADIMTPPFPDASFDYVSCKLTLCYVPHPAQTFKTLSRLVKPGGRLFISMPNKANLAFTVRLKNMLRITPRIPKRLLFKFCCVLAPVLYIGRKLTKKPGDSLRTSVFLLLNAMHSKFTYHTKEEVVAWFMQDKFNQITALGKGIAHSVNVRGTKPFPTNLD